MQYNSKPEFFYITWATDVGFQRNVNQSRGSAANLLYLRSSILSLKNNIILTSIQPILTCHIIYAKVNHRIPLSTQFTRSLKIQKMIVSLTISQTLDSYKLNKRHYPPLH